MRRPDAFEAPRRGGRKEEARTDNNEYIGSARKAMVAANDSTLMPTATKRRPAWLHMLRPKTTVRRLATAAEKNDAVKRRAGSDWRTAAQ